jgi:hypothetical protein
MFPELQSRRPINYQGGAVPKNIRPLTEVKK